MSCIKVQDYFQKIIFINYAGFCLNCINLKVKTGTIDHNKGPEQNGNNREYNIYLWYQICVLLG